MQRCVCVGMRFVDHRSRSSIYIYTLRSAWLICFLKEFYDCTHAQFFVRENHISLQVKRKTSIAILGIRFARSFYGRCRFILLRYYLWVVPVLCLIRIVRQDEYGLIYFFCLRLNCIGTKMMNGMQEQITRFVQVLLC